MRIKICVTKKDIENGKRREANKCPVSLAIKRTTKTPVNVTRNYVRYKGYAYAVPRSVNRFIQKFDKTGLGVPFNFNLEIPSV